MSTITPMPVGPAPAPQPPTARRRAWYRRPVFILALAVMALAAVGAGLFVVLSPNEITARGTVLDRLTGQPVAAASVNGGGKTATANARGKFQVTSITAGTVLRVRARNYATAQVAAAQAPVTVRLAPLPVPVTVTSALTGKPLSATLVLPSGDRLQARADGTATLYRIGPGETVTVTAARYLPAHPAVGTDRTVKVSLAPTLPTMRAQYHKWYRTHHYQAMIGWMLSPATGYTFTIDPGEWEQSNKQAVNDPATIYFGGGTASDGTAVSIQISRPAWHWNAAEIARNLVGAPRLQPVTLAGQQAWHGRVGGGHGREALWSYGGRALVTVSGANQHRVDAVMTGIIKAMTSTPQGS